MQLLKTLKPLEHTWPLRKQPLNLWMLLVHLQKNLRIFCFQKMLCLDNIVLQVSWFGCLHCNVWKVILKQSYLIL